MIFKNFNKINSAIIFILFIVLFNCKSTHNNSKNNQNIREIVFTKLLKVDEMIFDDFLDTIKLDSAAIPTNNLKFDSVEDSINFYFNESLFFLNIFVILPQFSFGRPKLIISFKRTSSEISNRIELTMINSMHDTTEFF